MKNKVICTIANLNRAYRAFYDLGTEKQAAVVAKARQAGLTLGEFIEALAGKPPRVPHITAKFFVKFWELNEEQRQNLLYRLSKKEAI